MKKKQMKLNYEIIRSDRKSIALEITKDVRLIVRAPNRMKYDEIESFVAKYDAWIRTNLEKAFVRKEAMEEFDQDELRAQAEKVIPGKVQYWSSLMGLMPAQVKITNAKTRFGSCSPKNSLCFSQYLMQFPEEAVDYVVVHELAHIQIKNHSSDFYALVARYLPDYKERAALLK